MCVFLKEMNILEISYYYSKVDDKNNKKNNSLIIYVLFCLVFTFSDVFILFLSKEENYFCFEYKICKLSLKFMTEMCHCCIGQNFKGPIKIIYKKIHNSLSCSHKLAKQIEITISNKSYIIFGAPFPVRPPFSLYLLCPGVTVTHFLVNVNQIERRINKTIR